MILEYYNFLSEKELDSLDKKCIDFNGNNFDKINKCKFDFNSIWRNIVFYLL